MTQNQTSWLPDIFLRKYAPLRRFCVVELCSAILGALIGLSWDGFPIATINWGAVAFGIFAGGVLGIFVEVFAELAFTALDAKDDIEESKTAIETVVKDLSAQIALSEESDAMLNQLASHSPFSGILGTLYAESGGRNEIPNVDQATYFGYLKNAISAVEKSYETIQHSGIDFFNGLEDFFDNFSDLEADCLRIFVVNKDSEIDEQEKLTEKWMSYWNRVGDNTESYWVNAAELEKNRPVPTLPDELPISSLKTTDVVVCDRSLCFQYNVETQLLRFVHSPNSVDVPFNWIFGFLAAEGRKSFGRAFKEVVKPDDSRSARHLKFRDNKGMLIKAESVYNNFRALSRVKKNHQKVLAVLKSNAYGIGIELVADTIQNATAPFDVAFGVSTLNEGVRIRNVCGDVDVLLMEGIVTTEAERVVQHGLQTLVWDTRTVDTLQLSAQQSNKIAKVQVKVETGMNRLGVRHRPGSDSSDLKHLLSHIKPLSNVEVVGIASQLSCGEDPDAAITKTQKLAFDDALEVYASVLGRTPEYTHMSNSASLLSCYGFDYDTVRVGGLLYGIRYPRVKNPTENSQYVGFESCVTVCGRVNQVHEIAANETVSYSAMPFKGGEPGVLAMVNMGYFDGVPTQFSPKGHVLIKGQRCRVVGQVHLGLTMVDVTNVPRVSVLDQVVFIGEDGSEKITVSEFANWCNMHPYEIICNFGNSLRVSKA